LSGDSALRVAEAVDRTRLGVVAAGKLYSSNVLQTYLQSFFANVGGSPWANVQAQYSVDRLAGGDRGGRRPTTTSP
jgi:hypothetical protein